MSTSLRILALISLAAQNVAWPQDPVPRLHVKHREVIGQRFLGNESHVEHFKLLERATTSILIGARNAIYNISLHDLTEIVDQHHASYFPDGMTIDRTARYRFPRERQESVPSYTRQDSWNFHGKHLRHSE